MMLTLSCNTLPHIGPALVQKLARCGIHTVQDLLLHLPFRYQDRTRITTIRDLREHDWRVISGKISNVEVS
jgi:ATP-dependent DNA helicase RecG